MTKSNFLNVKADVQSKTIVMKAIIIGTSLSGKTTIVRYLRKNTDYNICEIDEELTRINSGTFPENTKKKDNVLAPKIIKQILKSENILFFTSTDYFSDKDLTDARNLDFKIIQLNLSLDELRKRNEYRVKNEGYENMSQWLNGMNEYQERIFSKGLVDKRIDATQSTPKIVEELLDCFSE